MKKTSLTPQEISESVPEDSETFKKDRYASLQDRNSTFLVSQTTQKTSIAASEDRNATIRSRRITIPNRITALLYTGAAQEVSQTLKQNRFGS